MHISCVHAAHMAAVHNVEFDKSEFKCFLFFFLNKLKKFKVHIAITTNTHTYTSWHLCEDQDLYHCLPALILDLF